MKNSLYIDFDTEREDPIRINKTEDLVEQLKDEDEAKKMILNDMTTVCNALGTLIQIADDNGYFEAKKTSKMCIDYLNENFNKEIETNTEDPEETMG